MRGALPLTLVFGILAGCGGPVTEAVDFRERFEVYGVEEDDMLKLRGGPGIGFDVYAGLPNGTILRVDSCQQTGGTRWCKVALDRAPGLTGHVSAAYLRDL